MFRKTMYMEAVVSYIFNISCQAISSYFLMLIDALISRFGTGQKYIVTLNIYF